MTKNTERPFEWYMFLFVILCLYDGYKAKKGNNLLQPYHQWTGSRRRNNSWVSVTDCAKIKWYFLQWWKKHNCKIHFCGVTWQNYVFFSHVKLFSEARWWVLKSGRFISIGTTALTVIELSLSVFGFWHNIYYSFWKPPLTCVCTEVSDIQYICISLLFLL